MVRARRARKAAVYQPRDIEGIKAAAQATAEVLRELAGALRPGVSTGELDQLAARLISATGGQSAFRGYRGFPGQICISVNDEVVHGIGRPECILQAGDLVSLDVGIRLNGYIGDTAITRCVGGSPSRLQERLLDITRQCLEVGIGAARAGRPVNDIGRAIETHALAAGFSVIRDFVGHGCGRHLHEPPEVPNFACTKPGVELQPGMVLAIEPMLCQGSGQIVVNPDGWTARTRDGGLSAHFEHMIAITNADAEILTWPKKALE